MRTLAAAVNTTVPVYTSKGSERGSLITSVCILSISAFHFCIIKEEFLNAN